MKCFINLIKGTEIAKIVNDQICSLNIFKKIIKVMSTSKTSTTVSSIGEVDFPVSFGEWLKRRRKELFLTQYDVAGRASCSVFALRKIEAGDRRPSVQLAGLLAKSLELSSEDQPTFIRVARGELNLERLGLPETVRVISQSINTTNSPVPIQSTFPVDTINRARDRARSTGKAANRPTLPAVDHYRPGRYR